MLKNLYSKIYAADENIFVAVKSIDCIKIIPTNQLIYQNLSIIKITQISYQLPLT